MANVVGDIAIQVGADIGPLVRDLSKASSAVSKFGADAGKSGGGMSVLAKGAGILAASVVTASVAMAAFTKRAMDNIDALSKQARVAGVSVATFQAMAQVADEAGVSSESLSKNLVKMQNNLVDLGKGAKSQVEAFGALGLSYSQLEGMDASGQFELIAKAISGISDPAERTAAALDIFGKSGAEALLMMPGYSDALANATKFQKDFGLAVSDVDAQQIEAANDAIGRTQMIMAGLSTELAVTFAPALEKIATVMLGMAAAFNQMLESGAPVNQLFGSVTGRAEEFLGVDLYNKLLLDAEAFDRVKGALTSYKEAMAFLDVQPTIAAFNELEDTLFSIGEVDAAGKIGDLGAQLAMAKKEFDNGTISADQLLLKVEALKGEAALLLEAMGGINGLDTSGAIGAISALAGMLDVAKRAALALRAALPGPVASSKSNGVNDERGSQRDAYASSTLAPGTSTRPPRAPQNVDFGIADAGSGGGGGGGGDNGADDLKRMQDKFATEQEQIQAQYAEQLAKLEEFRQSKLLTEQEYNDLEAKVKEEHQKKLADIEQASLSARLDAYAGALGDLASLMQSSNSKLFKVGQAAAIAQSIVSGYQAAVDAWQKGMKIGGPPVAAAFTAASLVKTGAMIAKIKSQSPTGGGSTTNVGSGGAAAAAPAQSNIANVTWIGEPTREGFGSLTEKLNAEFKQGYILNLSFR